MGLFDFLLDEEPNENPREAEKEGRVADTEFAEDDARVRLHEEKLDVHKDRIRTGEVILHKDVIEEQKTLNVPVAHDQIVIERRTFDAEPTDETITDEETIHIPVSAEKVDIEKHMVVTGEISVHKQEVEETREFQDVVHKEVIDVHTDGDIDIVDDQDHEHLHE